ncbi:N-acetylmuramic acid 6-phosphate etherase [Sphingomonas sp. HT-1]|uniref:N-acetylmuramic acid 6-phosphate etherase n=1 Tax=unclassified Sphingomonas TaxID=196159 RepID=UPI000314FB50|nr:MULTISPECIES: N-acetylmuramic acid 6-phosphate etherase [unclassified Sphingomonas]KTF68879.1 N-acetylmuramic acid 6-phosphate etherase [Sphingomonas sp. WG]
MGTEAIDPSYEDIDQWPTPLAVAAMVEGQMAAIASLRALTGPIAAAAEAAAQRLGQRGRLVYVGAGTSGRVAVQDGVELYPTFNWPQARLHFIMAGGLVALTEAVEGAEDDAEAGAQAIRDARLTAEDVVFGLAASGRTPYTVAALRMARAAGALTIGIANNPDTPLLDAVEHPLFADTGAEIVAGSTRMKAGTAQKAILNLLSTAIMLRRGLVYRGRMVNMRMSNAKLLARGRQMVADLAGVDLDLAGEALDRADHDIKAAVLIAMGADLATVKAALAANPNLRDAIKARG